MGLWEQIHNPNFNVTEFSNIKIEAGNNGLPKPMQLTLYQKQADMAAALLPIGILLLNLHPGFPRVLSYT